MSQTSVKSYPKWTQDTAEKLRQKHRYLSAKRGSSTLSITGAPNRWALEAQKMSDGSLASSGGTLYIPSLRLAGSQTQIGLLLKANHEKNTSLYNNDDMSISQFIRANMDLGYYSYFNVTNFDGNTDFNPQMAAAFDREVALYKAASTGAARAKSMFTLGDLEAIVIGIKGNPAPQKKGKPAAKEGGKGRGKRGGGPGNQKKSLIQRLTDLKPGYLIFVDSMDINDEGTGAKTMKAPEKAPSRSKKLKANSDEAPEIYATEGAKDKYRLAMDILNKHSFGGRTDWGRFSRMFSSGDTRHPGQASGTSVARQQPTFQPTSALNVGVPLATVPTVRAASPVRATIPTVRAVSPVRATIPTVRTASPTRAAVPIPTAVSSSPRAVAIPTAVSSSPRLAIPVAVPGGSPRSLVRVPSAAGSPTVRVPSATSPRS